MWVRIGDLIKKRIYNPDGSYYYPTKPASKRIIPDEIIRLAEKRKQLRAEKKYQESDKIRKLIQQKGYKITDKKNNNYGIN